MSQDQPNVGSINVPPVAPEQSLAPDLPDHVYLVSYPKIVFLYPTVLTALLCSIVMWAKGDVPSNEASAMIAGSSAVDTTAAIVSPDAGASFTPDTTAAASTPPADVVEPTESAVAGNGPVAGEGPAGAVADAVPVAEPHSITIHSYHNICARIFLIVFALNMVVISFDFPRTTSLTWFFAISAMVIGLWLLFSKYEGLAPRLVQGLLSIKPWANASFYMIYALIMLFLYVWVMISRRFDYWEVKGNELLHHHGFLSNLERFSAPNLRIDKEINDLFEYLLLRSGRLIIHASNERRAIVLENVMFINSKEDRITRMLGALQVRVRTDKEL